MPSSRLLILLAFLLASTTAKPQALVPEEIQEPGPHRLQLKYLGELRAIGSKVETHKFPFHFYFSRTLDISEKEQEKADQRSIRFARFQGFTVLAISGNYFAAYSAEMVDKNARAKKTLDDVVLPILQTAVPYFVNDDTFDGYAIEISQHVRRKVSGLSSENAENLTFYFPRAAAQHLTQAKTPDNMQAALLECKVYVDAEPFNLWVNGDRPGDQPESYGEAERAIENPKPASAEAVPAPTVSQKLIKPPLPARFITPKLLDDLKAEYGSQITGVERDLRDQTHFADHVATEFVGFHEGAYLQLSLVYDLNAAPDSSRYRIAALTFDDHVSHLVRGALAHFQDAADFDGILFSVIAKTSSNGGSVAVEYFLPFQAIRCFARYDCSGQELLDSGYVLINGQRATLNLQVAESSQPSSTFHD